MNNDNVSEANKFEMIIQAATALPGIKIDRKSFLEKELSKYFDDEVVKKSIECNPAQAGITPKNIEHIAKSCINFEATKVTALSAVSGIPGGLAMLATVPADVVQYFGHIIRILQKLIYLYGWQEIFDEQQTLDDCTTNHLTLFIGVMFGVNAANATVTKVAQALAARAEKSLPRQALTKGMIYPIVKKIAKSIGIKMTKEVFAKGVGKVIPVIGAVASGGLTLFTFVKGANRLKNHLSTLPMCSVDFYKKNDVVKNNSIDADLLDISNNDLQNISMRETDS